MIAEGEADVYRDLPRPWNGTPLPDTPSLQPLADAFWVLMDRRFATEVRGRLSQ